ncbi:MAG: BMP family ABC transporter substrate-binding protein, partial [Firmicutes bacterium]|nr:BMP family ABC transporter substrate-binding protein [Bacillota bacterium]
MKRFVPVLLVLALLATVLAGCGKTAAPAQPATSGDQAKAPMKVVLLINGTLGDKSFFDSANAGIERAKKELGVDAKVIEMGNDPSKWEPTLADVSEEKWDLIILGTWQMTDALQKIAPQHPDKKYVIFDTAVDYTKAKLDNVYSILYNQNEGSYLAGALAAMVTGSKMPLANDKHTIGFLGGMDIPVINDFLVGYIEGAKQVDPQIKVAVSYVGDFANPAKGKEMALAQYQQGADIGFNVAGETGLGQLDAAKDMKRYAIGVDSDQAMLFKDSDPKKAELVVTSMLKRVDNSLVRAIKLYQDGKLTFGKAENLGLKDNAVGL